MHRKIPRFAPEHFARIHPASAVGPLQFEVLRHRLRAEYGAESQLEPAPWTAVRWLAPGTTLREEELVGGCRLAKDGDGRPVVLFPGDWVCQFFADKHPDVTLSAMPPQESRGRKW